MRTVEQKRAAHAFSRVAELDAHCRPLKEKYRTYVDRLGPTIVMSGLGQALAIERAAAGAKPKSDDEKAHAELYRSLQGWLCRADGEVYPSADNLLEAIMGHDEAHYLHAQSEALAWLEWHKKCCRATFPKGEGGEGE